MANIDRVIIRDIVNEAPGGLGFDIPRRFVVELNADGGYAHGQ